MRKYGTKFFGMLSYMKHLYYIVLTEPSARQLYGFLPENGKISSHNFIFLPTIFSWKTLVAAVGLLQCVHWSVKTAVIKTQSK